MHKGASTNIVVAREHEHCTMYNPCGHVHEGRSGALVHHVICHCPYLFECCSCILSFVVIPLVVYVIGMFSPELQPTSSMTKVDEREV